MASLIERIDRKARLMGEMMERTGCDPVSSPDFAGEMAMRNAIWRCLGCRSADACEAWLKSAPQGAVPPEFCANAMAFGDAQR